jgi:hypothetical protein
VQLTQILRFGALRGEACGGTGDGRPVVAQIAQLLGAPASEMRQQPFLDGAFGDGHEASAAAPPAGGDETPLAQCHQRFAQRHGGDAELGGEFGLAGQLLAVGEQSELDGVAQPPYHRIDSCLRADRSEDGSSGAAWVSLHGHHLVSWLKLYPRRA